MTETGGFPEACELASLVDAAGKQRRDTVSNEVEGKDQGCTLTSTDTLQHAHIHARTHKHISTVTKKKKKKKKLSKLDVVAHTWNPRTQQSREESCNVEISLSRKDSCNVETSFCCSMRLCLKNKRKGGGSKLPSNSSELKPGPSN